MSNELPSNINPDLWEFPTRIAFKAMAEMREDIEMEIVSVIQEVLPGDYAPSVKPSAKGNYVSVTVHVTFHNAEQVERVYREVRSIDEVRLCL